MAKTSFSCGAEDRDLALRRLHAARDRAAECPRSSPIAIQFMLISLLRSLRDSRHVAIGLNSCLSLPETRSAQGSTWANVWLNDEAVVIGPALFGIVDDLAADLIGTPMRLAHL